MCKTGLQNISLLNAYLGQIFAGILPPWVVPWGVAVRLKRVGDNQLMRDSGFLQLNHV
jgi:hypothetical protein